MMARKPLGAISQPRTGGVSPGEGKVGPGTGGGPGDDRERMATSLASESCDEAKGVSMVNRAFNLSGLGAAGRWRGERRRSERVRSAGSLVQSGPERIGSHDPEGPIGSDWASGTSVGEIGGGWPSWQPSVLVWFMRNETRSAGGGGPHVCYTPTRLFLRRQHPWRSRQHGRLPLRSAVAPRGPYGCACR